MPALITSVSPGLLEAAGAGLHARDDGPVEIALTARHGREQAIPIDRSEEHTSELQSLA